jgi:hypothetical protein
MSSIALNPIMWSGVRGLTRPLPNKLSIRMLKYIHKIEGGHGVEQAVIGTGTCDLPQVFPSMKDATYLSDASRRDTVANDSRHKHLLVSSFAQCLF